MDRSEAQLGIDFEIHARVTGTVEVGDHDPEVAAEAGATSAPTATEVPEFQQVPLPGTDPEARPRTSEKVGAELRRQTDYFVDQLEARGIDWLTDREARQWLEDLEVVRFRLREVEERMFAKPGGATEDGLYAEVIERIVGKQAKPAYLGEPVPELRALFDPNSLVIEEPDEAFEPEANSDGGTSGGDLAAARRAARPTRRRAKIAVARARCFDRHPEWHRALATRFA